MKKIIFTTDSLIMGGAEKIAIDYLKLLYETKKYNILLLINEDNGESGNILKDFIPEDVEYRFVVDKKIIEQLNKYRESKKNSLISKIFYNFYLLQRRKNYKKNIIKILKEEQYDYLIDFYFKIPKEVIDSRTISWIHSSLKNISLKNIKKYNEKLEKLGKVILITEDLKKQFIKIFPNYIDKLEVIYNFFNINSIMERANEKLGIDEEFILACSRLDKNKDIETLIKAYDLLIKENKIKEKLFILGDGPTRTELEEMVKNYKLEKNIVFYGTEENPYKFMKKAKLFVHSSKKEGFGMVLVEAMINKTMVISTDCPVGPSGILENGKNGVLVEVGDYKDMAEKIYEYLNDEEKRKEKIKNANERINDFSKEKIKEKIFSILK